jgi:hypothetical protein
MIYHGSFATGFFQTLYTPPPSLTLTLVNSLEYHVLVVLPLFTLAMLFRPLLPTAFGALLLPMAVSALAGAQADIPRSRQKFWSRPLVALLYYLQPLARGWARYQGSLRAPRSSLARRENLRTALRDRPEADFSVLEYWNDKGFDRTEFLRVLIERLDQQGWQHKVDAGWNDYDVQIYGSAWSVVQLVTVSETLGHGKQILRAALRPAGTLFARAFFWSLLAAELIIIGFLGRHAWWPYLILLSLPLFVWYLARDQRDLQRVIAVFIDELALEMRLKKIEPEKL